MSKDSQLYRHAVLELRAKGLMGTAQPLPNTAMGTVLGIIDLLDNQTIKGTVPRYLIDMVNKLATMQPLSPLTGDEKEWEHLSPGVEFNKRCPSVIREDKGQAYDTEAVAFEDATGHRYANQNSKRAITFPYVPIQTTEKV